MENNKPAHVYEHRKHTTDWKLGYAEQTLNGIVAILEQNSFKNKGVTTSDANTAIMLAKDALEVIYGRL
jgi:hypothetical protein